MTITTPAAKGPIVIVGAGQAGGRAAEALRSAGHIGPITLIGEEPYLPYERPALSKDFLRDGGLDRIAWVRPAAWYEANSVTLLQGRKAVAIDRDHCVVALDDGSQAPYEALILATGARARPLTIAGASHPLVGCLRTLGDSDRLQRRLLPGAHIVVIGAGFIGLEVAATARSRGCAVTVLEAADLPMARCVPPLLGSHYAAVHRAQGVDLRLSRRLVGITDEGGRAVVHTSAGEALPADAVLVGIGIVPNFELAQAAGLEVEDGVVVDEYGRTSDAQIYAAGDVSRHFNPLLGRLLRLESWQNAQNQAITAARNVLGAAKPYAEVPWFWSDQFDLNLQIAGLPEPGDEVIRRGQLGRGPVTFFHLRAGRLAAAIGINSGREVRIAREIIAMRGAPSAASLADEAASLAGIWADLKRSSIAA
jgi:3-phenylpropionate/trans-cinnamate dioxygenase ferredoxin reductase component